MTGVGFQYQRANHLRAENAALSQSAAEVSKLKEELAKFSDAAPQNMSAEISRLREANRDLLKLRNEVRQLRERREELEGLRAENERLHSRKQTASAEPGHGSYQPLLFSLQQLANQGQATPEAAMQTFLWAARHKNVAVLANCIYPDHLPGGSSNSATAVDYVIQRFSEELESATTFEIVARREVSENIVLGIQIRSSDSAEKVAVLLRQVGDEWKLQLGH